MTGRQARPSLTETLNLLMELAPGELSFDILIGLDADELRAHVLNSAIVVRRMAAPGTEATDLAALRAELDRPTRGDRWAMPWGE